MKVNEMQPRIKAAGSSAQSRQGQSPCDRITTHHEKIILHKWSFHTNVIKLALGEYKNFAGI